MYQAIIKEIELRKSYLNDQIVNTVYFGGGTPSVFSGDQITSILACIRSFFSVAEHAEITLEANPEDLTIDYLQSIRKAGVNRLSIGIQSFDPARLQFVNRNHSPADSENAIHLAHKAGFNNLTADLIMGIPPEDRGYWQRDLLNIVELEPPHLSLYSLTIEDQTAFGKWKKNGKLTEISEEEMAWQFEFASEFLESRGYIQYEVSNYCKPGFESKHNSAYWQGDHYLGIGPGAHSFDGASRAFNVENNTKYMEAIVRGELPLTTEILSETQCMNELLLTGMRRKAGIDLAAFERRFGRSLRVERKSELDLLLSKNWIEIDGDILKPTKKGFLMSDEISLRLFYDAE